jgi:hypothetical protein
VEVADWVPCSEVRIPERIAIPIVPGRQKNQEMIYEAAKPWHCPLVGNCKCEYNDVPHPSTVNVKSDFSLLDVPIEDILKFT